MKKKNLVTHERAFFVLTEIGSLKILVLLGGGHSGAKVLKVL